MLDTYLDGFRQQAPRRNALDTTTPPTRSASSARSSASENARKRNELLDVLPRRPTAAANGTNGRKSPGATRARPATSAMCPTPGSPRNTCWPSPRMVASEREATEKLVLASGLPWSWISQGARILRARADDPLRQAGLPDFRDGNPAASSSPSEDPFPCHRADFT